MTYGSGDMKKRYLPRMLTDEWGGTMCLTEAGTGSDVGALKSRAVKQADGSYLITGRKIFISEGEQDRVTNIVHPAPARIEGDPAGATAPIIEHIGVKRMLLYMKSMVEGMRMLTS